MLRNPIHHPSLIAVLLVAALALCPSLTQAQEASTGGTAPIEKPTWPTHTTLGVGFGLDFNSPSSKDYVVDGITVNSGSMTIGPELHVLLELPIATNLMFAPRLAFNSIGNKWTGGKGTLTRTGAGTDSTSLATSIQTLGADLLFKYSFSGFHVMLGPQLSGPLSATYSHASSVGSASADIPAATSFYVAVQAGIGYDIPLNQKNSMWLTPEVFYDYFLTDFATKSSNPSSEYLASTIQAGLSLKFDMSAEKEAAPPPPTATATITARGVMPDNSASPEPIVPQQATHNRTSIPLLPYVFFEDNSSQIPARYSRQGSTGFETESLKDRSALDANHALLDIIGLRLKQNPSTNITLTGTNCNSGLEKNNINLSKARAMAVKDYLVNTWGIDAGRVTVDQRNLPDLATNPVTKAGKEENRRVEITASDRSITEPVKIENRENATVGETIIRFETSVRPQDRQFKDWTIALDQAGTQIGSPLSGVGAPPATTTMTIANAGSYVNQPVHYKLVATTSDGQQVVADGMTRIVNRTVDRENLERYGMLSFDFNTSEINPRAHQMLDLIGESISREATGVTVTGYCDSTGSAEYNQALSEQRANSAITALRSMTKLPANANVRGYGIRDPKFTNTLPEGRQLNRRVEVAIEKSSR